MRRGFSRRAAMDASMRTSTNPQVARRFFSRRGRCAKEGFPLRKSSSQRLASFRSARSLWTFPIAEETGTSYVASSIGGGKSICPQEVQPWRRWATTVRRLRGEIWSSSKLETISGVRCSLKGSSSSIRTYGRAIVAQVGSLRTSYREQRGQPLSPPLLPSVATVWVSSGTFFPQDCRETSRPAGARVGSADSGSSSVRVSSRTLLPEEVREGRAICRGALPPEGEPIERSGKGGP